MSTEDAQSPATEFQDHIGMVDPFDRPLRDFLHQSLMQMVGSRDPQIAGIRFSLFHQGNVYHCRFLVDDIMVPHSGDITRSN